MKTTNLNRALVTCLMLAVGSLAAQTSQADPRTHDRGVNARQHHQAHRIGKGIRSGELTRPEARRLAGEQRDIRQLERAYKSDGKLTAGERRDLHHEQNQASHKIYRQKHDAQQRP